jgi:5-(carboxyamino)imidazole ribonucleotide mutase
MAVTWRLPLQKAMRIFSVPEHRQVDCNVLIHNRIRLDIGYTTCIVCVMLEIPSVAVLMGSKSDWATMRHAAELLHELGIRAESKIVSAHRTPDLLVEFAKGASDRGLKIIIAGAGGAAHLPGMLAANTHLPVLGVPIESRVLRGVDSLLSIVQMPSGIPVPTLAIGEAGAKNAALAAASILALSDSNIRANLIRYREEQTRKVLETDLD